MSIINNMRLLILFFFTFLATVIKAQEISMEKAEEDLRTDKHFGIRIGVNNSIVYDETGEEFNPEPKDGFAGGVFLSVPIIKFLGLRPEILLSQKGFHATGKVLGNKYDLNRITTYIDFPLLIEIKPTRILTLVAGPQYSYLLIQADRIKNDDNTRIQENEFMNDNSRKNIISAAFGFDVNINHFVFSGRYNFDLQKNSEDRSSETPRYKNMWLQATAGLRF